MCGFAGRAATFAGEGSPGDPTMTPQYGTPFVTLRVARMRNGLSLLTAPAWFAQQSRIT